METDCFVFCQDDLVNTSFSVFEEMKKNGELIDFKITIQNRCFFAHRLILAAGIPYLRTMFAASVSEIPLEGIDPDIFEDVINFAYCGKISITIGNVQSLLVASQLLHLTKVHEACLKYMALRVNVTNVFQFRSFAGNIQSLRLAATCDRCILRNFDAFTFARSDEFLQLPFPYLKEMISRDDMNVISEEKVFEAIMKWVKASPLDRHCLLPELLCCVRITRLSPQYLVENVSSEELIRSSGPCMYLVEETKNYHLLPNKPSSFLGSTKAYPRNTTGHGLYAICSSALGRFLELYDSDKGVWIPLAPVGDEKIDNAVGFNGKLYIFRNYKDEVETFDLKTFKRESLCVSESYWNSKNCFKQIVVHDKKFYAFTSKEMFCFDPELKKWLGPKAIIECEDSGIESVGEYIYITGGYDRKCSATKVCRRYKSTTGNLSEVSSMLVGRRCHGCAALNGKLYVCGGARCKQFEKAEVYDPLTDQWSFITPVKSMEHEIFLAAYKGRLYAFGSDAMEIFDLEHDEWKLGVPAPSSCKFIKFLTIPFPGDVKACPEFSKLRLQPQRGAGFGLGATPSFPTGFM